MGKSKQTTIAEITFTSQKQCVDYTRTLMGNLTVGQKICPAHPDYPFVNALARRHPEFAIKKGSGINYYFYSSPSGYHTPCFHIRRTDGTSIDFSYLTCIRGESNNARSIKLAVLREIIFEDKTKLKSIRFIQSADCWGEITCPVQNWNVSFEKTHADHAEKSFKYLVESFLKLEGLTLEELKIFEDSKGKSLLSDAQLEIRWLCYHRKEARITLVSEAANLNRPPFSKRALTPKESQLTFGFKAIDLGLAPPKEVIRRRRATYEAEQLEFEF